VCCQLSMLNILFWRNDIRVLRLDSQQDIYFLINVEYIEEFRDGEKINLEVWADLHVVSPLTTKKLPACLILCYVYIYVQMFASTGPEPSDDFIHIRYSRDHRRPPLWSSCQRFWLQIQRSWVRFPALPDFLRSIGSGTGSTQPREDNWGATWKKK
jgi:hypothetical protein